MNIKIEISVIVPVYNRDKTISRCINSILDQSYPVKEIIVVDDNSTDSTESVIKEFKIENLKYIKLKKNIGAQNARNVGIKAATGNWIGFLDSDDEWIKTKLEEQIGELEKFNYREDIIVYSNCTKINLDTGSKTKFDCRIQEPVDINLLYKTGPMFQSMLVSKKAIKEVNYLDINVMAFQEWDFALSLSPRNNFIFIDKELFKYYVNHDKSISSNTGNMINAIIYIHRKYYMRYKKMACNDLIYKHLSRYIAISITKNYSLNFLGFSRKFLQEISNKDNAITKLSIDIKIIKSILAYIIQLTLKKMQWK
ncbi:glycosyltransferase family 2 protein [Alphaproteobacteria bacterium LSUCC0684]